MKRSDCVRIGWLILLPVTVAGCAWSSPFEPDPVLAPYEPNPVTVAYREPELFWEDLVEVVHRYFEIEYEQPVRNIGGVLTEGRIDTRPRIGATIFEPWHRDSVGRFNRVESTLQSIRRTGEIKVVPTADGYSISVAVFRELEDVSQPLGATASAASFRDDSSMTRVVSPVGAQQTNEGWIPKGRDTALEQAIIRDLVAKFGRISACSPETQPDIGPDLPPPSY